MLARPGPDAVVTDYGVVRLSGRALAWLDSIDPAWREISGRCGPYVRKVSIRHRIEVRNAVRRLEDAIYIAAMIAWRAGDELREF